VLRHPAKEFLEAWRGLRYPARLQQHLQLSAPPTLEDVLSPDSAEKFKRASEEIAGSNCELRLFNRQACRLSETGEDLDKRRFDSVLLVAEKMTDSLLVSGWSGWWRWCCCCV
jgi:hypothetical protein